MLGETLRSALRLNTRANHDRLEECIPDFTSLYQYKLFAFQNYLLRVSIEPALDSFELWTQQRISPSIRDDLFDLGIDRTPDCLAPFALSDNAEKIGALYVLEGSALGAKLLFKRARKLGLNDGFGARHLAQQISDPARWSKFIDLLASVPEHDHSRTIAAANRVFDHAHVIYQGAKL